MGQVLWPSGVALVKRSPGARWARAGAGGAMPAEGCILGRRAGNRFDVWQAIDIYW